ncbi:hypothetical protein TWF173_002760 [Orbilia oligospora]|nr:hypothetical protein TWF173_002760 [Orbilia oligospora]
MAGSMKCIGNTCVRFPDPSEWDPDPVWNEDEEIRTYRDPMIPALRTYTSSLDYFPDITELHITRSLQQQRVMPS